MPKDKKEEMPKDKEDRKKRGKALKVGVGVGLLGIAGLAGHALKSMLQTADFSARSSSINIASMASTIVTTGSSLAGMGVAAPLMPTVLGAAAILYTLFGTDRGESVVREIQDRSGKLLLAASGLPAMAIGVALVKPGLVISQSIMDRVPELVSNVKLMLKDYLFDLLRDTSHRALAPQIANCLTGVIVGAILACGAKVVIYTIKQLGEIGHEQTELKEKSKAGAKLSSILVAMTAVVAGISYYAQSASPGVKAIMSFLTNLGISQAAGTLSAAAQPVLIAAVGPVGAIVLTIALSSAGQWVFSKGASKVFGKGKAPSLGGIVGKLSGTYIAAYILKSAGFQLPGIATTMLDRLNKNAMSTFSFTSPISAMNIMVPLAMISLLVGQNMMWPLIKKMIHRVSEVTSGEDIRIRREIDGGDTRSKEEIKAQLRQHEAEMKKLDPSGRRPFKEWKLLKEREGGEVPLSSSASLTRTLPPPKKGVDRLRITPQEVLNDIARAQGDDEKFTVLLNALRTPGAAEVVGRILKDMQESSPKRIEGSPQEQVVADVLSRYRVKQRDYLDLKRFFSLIAMNPSLMQQVHNALPPVPRSLVGGTPEIEEKKRQNGRPHAGHSRLLPPPPLEAAPSSPEEESPLPPHLAAEASLSQGESSLPPPRQTPKKGSRKNRHTKKANKVAEKTEVKPTTHVQRLEGERGRGVKVVFDQEDINLVQAHQAKRSFGKNIKFKRGEEVLDQEELKFLSDKDKNWYDHEIKGNAKVVFRYLLREKIEKRKQLGGGRGL